MISIPISESELMCPKEKKTNLGRTNEGLSRSVHRNDAFPFIVEYEENRSRFVVYVHLYCIPALYVQYKCERGIT